MNKKHVKGWLKHWDFILLDILSLQLAFVFSYWLLNGYGNPYDNSRYQFQSIVLLLAQLLTILFVNDYGGILRRKRFDEAISVFKQITEIMIITVLIFFLIHGVNSVSRLQFGFTSVLFFVLDSFLRFANKHRINKYSSGQKNKKSIVLVTSRDNVSTAMKRLQDPVTYKDFFVSGVILMDGWQNETVPNTEIPMIPLGEEAVQNLTHSWVDEVFILQPDHMPFPTKLMDALMEMGITVNYTMTALENDRWPVTDLRKLGDYKVLTNSVRFAPAGQLAVKRAMDILGGIVGCILTGIIFVFVAPVIYRKSPGPIFFTQERVGQNGKKFKMHKFRSMYMDAEERKAALMEQNKIRDGLMFKIDDDPRIIGSEKKGKDGKPKGIGNFIRNTSLDEFPQFFDILVGNMSLVGWRPCTISEWEKYDLQHRIRASMKPGLTGMWQVSGRSEITDFDTVVRLDREYIENWSLLLDIKIILKTIVVVVKRKGAE